MNVGSLFSGIGGLDKGLHDAGHRHVFFCESDEWRREVLAARWPGVPIYDDVRAVGTDAGGGHGRSDAGVRPGRDRATAEVPEHVDLLCGGFPCQDLSVAGQRKGLDGERSGLFFEFARVIDLVRPGWVLVENVPGLLSSNGGRDFGVVLGTLADLGYGLAWRVLDSRYFGVPQRRRRVFILGALSDGDPAAAAGCAGEVLAVGSRCPGHPPTGTETGPDPAGAPVSGTLGGRRGFTGDDVDRGGALIAQTLRVGGTDTGGGYDSQQLVTHALTSEGADASEDGTGRGTPLVAAPLTKGSANGAGVNQSGRRQEDDVNLVHYGFNHTGGGSKDVSVTADATPPIDSSNQGIGVLGAGVRRLTPVECERLQALPDGWTDLGGTPDSRRYSALGDAVTASVGYWIGCRL